MPLKAPAEATEGHQRLPATSPYPERFLGQFAAIVWRLLRVTAAQARWASRVGAE